MHQLDRHIELPEDQKDLLEEARKVTDEVLERIEATSKKYGTAYTLADIEVEFDAELLDIVGWPLLQVIRMRLIMQKKLANLNSEYLKKFLEYHNTQYLTMLRDTINNELTQRAKDVI